MLIVPSGANSPVSGWWERVSSAAGAILSGRFVRDVVVLAGGTAIAQVVAVLVSPLLTRLYTPEDFGVLATYAALLGILTPVAALKYNVAIPLPRSRTAAANLLVASLTSVAMVTVVATAAIGLLQVAIPGQAGLFALGLWIWLLPLGLMGGGVYAALMFWSIRKKGYRLIARTKLSQAVGKTGIQLALGLLNLAPGGLLLGHLTGQTAGVGTFARRLWSDDRRLLRNVTRKRVLAMVRRYRGFAAMGSGAGLLNSGGMYLAPLLLVTFYGPGTAGLFALAERMVKVPVGLVSVSVGQVYFGELSRSVDQPRRLRAMLFKISGRLALLGLVPALALGAFGEPLFAFVFGGEWAEAGRFAQVLALSMFFSFVMMPAAQNLNALERQDLVMTWSALRLAAVVVSLTVPTLLGWTDFAAVTAYAIGMSLSYLALFGFVLAAIRGRAEQVST